MNHTILNQTFVNNTFSVLNETFGEAVINGLKSVNLNPDILTVICIIPLILYTISRVIIHLSKICISVGSIICLVGFTLVLSYVVLSTNPNAFIELEGYLNQNISNVITPNITNTLKKEL